MQLKFNMILDMLTTGINLPNATVTHIALGHLIEY